MDVKIDVIMKYLFLTFCALFALEAFSQAPNFDWTKSFVANETDEPFSIISTSDGGYIIAGHSNSTISGDKSDGNILPILNQFQRFDIWIVKFNALGVKIWDKTIGGNYNEFEPQIIASSDNGFVLVCHSYSHISGQKTANNVGGADFWVIKYDESGTKVWDKTFGATGTELSPKIVSTNDGFLICGQSNSNASGSKSNNSYNNSNDIWLIKIGNNGQKIWDKTFGGFSNEIKPIISINNIGEIILGASSNSNISGKKTENAIGGFDIWVMKLSPTGDLIWDKTMGTEDDEYLGGVTIDSDNNIILVASSGAQGYSHTTILIKKWVQLGKYYGSEKFIKQHIFLKLLEIKMVDI
ncbi:hypothetical protein [Emticicia oligotrophica]|uniref:hypothetical protein n=2 Tax=Leadbetterellaceae TaxID=3141702 RepID=UPI00273BE3A1|nr:hypothetical protein [Emticicia oligotrophica]